jgi:hypothetical protein
MSSLRDDTFAFEHNQGHRQLWGSMAPLTRFSVLPYTLYPGETNQGGWHLDHEQAHRDAQNSLPGTFGGVGFLDLILGLLPPEFIFPEIPTAQQGTISQLSPGFNIQDYDLSVRNQREWWTFQNHYWHLDAQSIQNSEAFVFPFY